MPDAAKVKFERSNFNILYRIAQTHQQAIIDASGVPEFSPDPKTGRPVKNTRYAGVGTSTMGCDHIAVTVSQIPDKRDSLFTGELDGQSYMVMVIFNYHPASGERVPQAAAAQLANNTVLMAWGESFPKRNPPQSSIDALAKLVGVPGLKSYGINGDDLIINTPHLVTLPPVVQLAYNNKTFTAPLSNSVW